VKVCVKVSNVEVNIKKGCIRATHFMGSDKKFIYNSGIADEEIQWEIDDFRAQYPETWWTVEQIIILRLDTTGRLKSQASDGLHITGKNFAT
jgi:hypothetical protein